MEQPLRLAILGGGTIAELVLRELRAGRLDGIKVVALMGRPGSGRSAQLAERFGVSYTERRDGLLAAKPDAVLEAASHQAVREHLVELLNAGLSVVVLSAGALTDDVLRHAAEDASKRSGALLYVPSGGIGGLDALKTACLGGVDEASIQVAKPPAAWRGIPYVDARGFKLDGLSEPLTLFEGSARDGVPHFPQNVNIAAVLSFAGIGLDRTRLKVVADPSLKLNTHTINIAGRCGRFTVVLENVPAPDNPKTSWLACYSALAALRSLRSTLRYGT